jgi:stage II sporulation protein D
MGLGRRIGRLAGVLAVLALWPMGCTHKDRARSLEGVPVIRVRLLQDQHLVTLTATRPPTAFPNSLYARQLALSKNAAVPVRLTAAGWQVGGETVGGEVASGLGIGELTLQPDGDGTLSVNGIAYRGRYRFVPVAGGDGRFDVVNDVDVDGYLKSVVSKEVLKEWHPDAFRAQAIVARTYALYEWASLGGRGTYDLNDDVRSQVYGGLGVESAKSKAAVDATAGVVLVNPGPDGNKVFKAYFSSCCGGITASAADAFNEPDIKPLSARYVGPLCSQSPHFNWGPVVLSKAELTRRLRQWGQNRDHALKGMADLVSIDLWKTNEHGRPARFLVTDARGTQYSLVAEEMRWAVNTGGVVLKSAFVRPVNEGDTVRFAEGHGWGHGVGMCQWCAESQAEEGMRGEEIVLRSFPGAKLVRAY